MMLRRGKHGKLHRFLLIIFYLYEGWSISSEGLLEVGYHLQLLYQMRKGDGVRMERIEYLQNVLQLYIVLHF